MQDDVAIKMHFSGECGKKKICSDEDERRKKESKNITEVHQYKIKININNDQVIFPTVQIFRKKKESRSVRSN